MLCTLKKSLKLKKIQKEKTCEIIIKHPDHIVVKHHIIIYNVEVSHLNHTLHFYTFTYDVILSNCKTIPKMSKSACESIWKSM